jgi:tRNA A-37 threonylcarbamoyl transferase component Bud32
MKIFKQPSGMDFTQPLLNKVLGVHVALMHEAELVRGNSSTSKTFYDAKTREMLDWSNWRVRLIRKLGT